MRTIPTDNKEEYIKRYIAYIQPRLALTDQMVADMAETAWEMYDGSDDTPEDMADYEIEEWRNSI